MSRKRSCMSGHFSANVASCLRLGTRTVGPVIVAAAGTFVAVVVGEHMVGAEVGTLGLALGRMGFALSA